MCIEYLCQCKYSLNGDHYLMDDVIFILKLKGHFKKWMRSVTFINQHTYILSFREKVCIRILDVGGSVLQNNYYFFSLKYMSVYLQLKLNFYSLIEILKSEATVQDYGWRSSYEK